MNARRVGWRPPLHLKTDDSAALEALASQRPESAVARRARALLMLAAGTSLTDVSRAVGLSTVTINRWRDRFEEGGCDAILDRPRPVSPRRVAALTRFLNLSSSLSPTGLPWTSRSLAQATGLTQSTVVRFLHRYGIQLPKTDAERATMDRPELPAIAGTIGLFVCAEIALLAVATRPAQPRTAPSADSPSRADETRRADAGATRDHAAAAVPPQLLAALEAYAREDTRAVPGQTMAVGVRKFLDLVDGRVPAGLGVALVVDESGDGQKLPVRWIARRPRYRVIRAVCRNDWLAHVNRCLGPAPPGQRDDRQHLLACLALKLAISEHLAYTMGPRPFEWVRPEG
jgi:transposase